MTSPVLLSVQSTVVMFCQEVTTIQPGDVILGLASSGIHSNGFSLVRYILEQQNIALDATAPFADASWAETLLTPTRIYVKSCLAAHTCL